jgi:hypothetical protein
LWCLSLYVVVLQRFSQSTMFDDSVWVFWIYCILLLVIRFTRAFSLSFHSLLYSYTILKFLLNFWTHILVFCWKFELLNLLSFLNFWSSNFFDLCYWWLVTFYLSLSLLFIDSVIALVFMLLILIFYCLNTYTNIPLLFVCFQMFFFKYK